MSRPAFALAFLALLALPMTGFTAQPAPPTLLPNGAFERTAADRAADWEAYGAGYTLEARGGRSGSAIRCTSADRKGQFGARATVTLNQKEPRPILVQGWSKAEAVDGVKDENYSLYVDLEYTDGTPLWGQVAGFSTGSHDWEHRRVLVLPAKPVRTVLVHALFRSHAGTAWFDDFSAEELAGADLFDSQKFDPGFPPTAQRGPEKLRVTSGDGLSLGFDSQGHVVGVRSGTADLTARGAGGFFLHRVDLDRQLFPVSGSVLANRESVEFDGGAGFTDYGVKASFRKKHDAIVVEGEVRETSGRDHAATLYLALPVGGPSWQWGQDMRRSQPITTSGELTIQVRASAGATGGISLYPWACVTGPKGGIGILNGLDEPSIFRIFYHAPSRRLVIAWDFALTGHAPESLAHKARFRCTLFRLSSDEAPWGFRAAAARVYRLAPEAFVRRAKAEGIWIPFTDPARVQKPEDFGFAYHEGDNSMKSDDERGILSFRYTEPMSYWMPMPPSMPRAYDDAIALLRKNAAGNDPASREPSRATLNSGTRDEGGRFNLQFQKEPWADGALFILNPSPALPATADQPTKATVNYTAEMGDRMYGPEAARTRGVQDGEYLDSLEAWGDALDFRPEHLAASTAPLTFDTDSYRPVLPQAFSTFAFTKWLSTDLHRRGKLLMANSTPIRYSIFAPQLDVMGIEVNWLSADGKYQPDSDETMSMRRTLSAQKPYLLLMNTDFDRFNHELVERYFQRCLFYGIYPSMFSADAATRPYWQNPAWYNRDRDLFKKYVPLIKQLSAAGWQPVTHARSSDQEVWLERYGTRYLTALNPTAEERKSQITLDAKALGPTAANTGPLFARLSPGECRVLDLGAGR